jgi:hypothetical protein
MTEVPANRSPACPDRGTRAPLPQRKVNLLGQPVRQACCLAFPEIARPNLFRLPFEPGSCVVYYRAAPIRSDDSHYPSHLVEWFVCFLRSRLVLSFVRFHRTTEAGHRRRTRQALLEAMGAASDELVVPHKLAVDRQNRMDQEGLEAGPQACEGAPGDLVEVLRGANRYNNSSPHGGVLLRLEIRYLQWAEVTRD